ncbi:uncharacterized protein J3D65DRAFT_440206 [Phyllosticta citribraziliensis]|uniref:Uncharacterized protein n=1 Tax=Phyllosticta citribraziliensis TaxID=989973 RepID=A0ABR1LIT5_9PEZI
MDQQSVAGFPDALDLRQSLPHDIDERPSKSSSSLLSPRALHFASPAPPVLDKHGPYAHSSSPSPSPSSPCNLLPPPSLLEPAPDPSSVPGLAHQAINTSTTSTPTLLLPRPDSNHLHDPLAASPDAAHLLRPSPHFLRAGHDLRLPSFQLLGIATPHPDRPLDPDNNTDCCSSPHQPLPPPTTTTTRHSDAPSPKIARAPPSSGEAPPDPLPTPNSGSALKDPKLGDHRVELPTPPPDTGTKFWANSSHVRNTPMDSPARSDLERSSPGFGFAPSASAQQSTSSAHDPSLPDTNGFGWLNGGLQAIMADMVSSRLSDNSVKVLSHALPCPSPTGQAFPHIIYAIHDTIPPASTVWINVFHAVPGRFNMADLPISPPTTPGPVVGGEDYFTSKVFDSAVPLHDQDGDAKVARSPRPVVPPGTVDVSIVERFIPPSTSSELAGLFSATSSRSILLDRLVELSPDRGTLLFIYPTKTGGKAFMNSYLGPILDPILRAMHVVHNLSADLGASLGHMAAVDHLMEFDEMLRLLEIFVLQLSGESSTLDRFNRARATFAIVHAERQRVKLDRKVWASDWWIKQEKPRVRTAISKYFRLAQKLPADVEIMPTNLIQEVLEGVGTKPYEHGGPEEGVEVGVFVIRRSS